MFFSVVIPTYNRLETLPAALASVWGQTFAGYEAIVVDDGSTDGTWDYLQSLGSRVRAFRQNNRGPGAARNLGAAQARGEYLAFLDSDDLWFPWTLASYASAVALSHYPGLLTGAPFRFREHTAIADVRQQALAYEAFPDYLAGSATWVWGSTSALVVRATAFCACGGFANENVNAEDHDLALKLGVAPGFVRIGAPLTFAYREHAESLVGDLSRSLDGVRRMIRAERDSQYPGGRKRARERGEIVTRHARPVILAALRRNWREAFELYRATLRWHVELRRWRFIFVVPLLVGGYAIETLWCGRRAKRT